MKLVRFLLIAAGVLAGLCVIGLLVVFNDSFQTWAVHKAIASQPGLNATIGKVSAGWRSVELADVRFARDGIVVKAPKVEAELPLLSAALFKNVSVSRLVAKDWTVDLSASSSPPAASAAAPTAAESAATAAVATSAFAGVLNQVQLPVDLSLDGVQLEGIVVLPSGKERAKVALTGGGIRAGQEGTLALTSEAALADPAMNAVGVRGSIRVAMDTPRTFQRFAAKLDLTAQGARFPGGAAFVTELTATRTAAGEDYSGLVSTHDRQVVTIRAELPKPAGRLAGTWKIDLREADLATFSFGQPVPALTATGEGRFEAEGDFAAIYARGRLNATADKLIAVAPELAEIGALNLTADFNLARRGNAVGVEKLEATIATTQPIATVRALQVFQFDVSSGELRAQDPARELFDIALQGVPLAWAKPWMKDWRLAGNDVRGEFVALARGGGMNVRSKSPLTIEGIELGDANEAWLRGVDVAVLASADYTPKGWQAEVTELIAKSGDTRLLSLAAKAGQLSGANQAVKATGKIIAHLPALRSQPIAADSLAVTNGEAEVEFAASASAKHEIQAKLAVRNLAVDPAVSAGKLPAVLADVRADIEPSGKVALSAPIRLESERGKSDLTFAGTLIRRKDTSTLEAQLTSTRLILDDAKLLAAVIPDSKASSQQPNSSGREVKPPWDGIEGVIGLRLKQLIYSDTFQMNDVNGTLRLDAGAVKLEGLQAAVGVAGHARLGGAVSFDGTKPNPYALDAQVALREFDPGPLFLALNPQQPPTVEGMFDIDSRLVGQAANLADLMMGAGGDFQITSKGGVFRGLPLNVSHLAENTGKIAAWIASAGTALGALTGRKDTIDVANRAEAVGEVARHLSALRYDQLSVSVSRDATLNTTLKNFTLIAPEVRLTGTGRALRRGSPSLLDDGLSMEFLLRARGRQAELLKYLELLEPQPDDLGYAACTLAIKVGGTIGRPDASELSSKLVALALEKSGLFRTGSK